MPKTIDAMAGTSVRRSWSIGFKKNQNYTTPT